MPGELDIMIPTCDRPAALAVTLTSLLGQSLAHELRIVVSDQGEPPLDEADLAATAGLRELVAVRRVLQAAGLLVEWHTHLPRRGMAEQRQFLLDHTTAPYALFLDDDLVLEPDVVARLLRVLRRERCGFVGAMPIGLSYLHDVRPQEQLIEFWDGPVEPETIVPGSAAWMRHDQHNAANIHHIAERLGVDKTNERLYRVAWVGGCVLYDTAALRDVGGFGFWQELPAAHAGEDVLAQLRVMARYGGCGLLPSGVYHQELPTTVHDRSTDAPWALPLEPGLGQDSA